MNRSAALQGAAFGRLVMLTLGTRNEPNMAQYGNAGPNSTPLRVGFEVQKNVKSAPNTATVTVYNLAPKNRNGILPGTNITLFAGYADQLQVLFVGLVDTVKHARAGADVTTTITCLDGAAAIVGTQFSRQYATGTRLLSIFSDIAARLAAVSAANPPGLSSAASVGVAPTEVLSNAVSFAGSCRDALTTLCAPRGLEWSIQNGALQVVAKALQFGEQAQVVSSATGLFGAPSRTKDLVEFTCLLNPSIAPGRMVFLNARDVTGYFKVRGGKWTGDTHDAKWQAEIEAVALPNAVGLESTTAIPLLGDEAIA